MAEYVKTRSIKQCKSHLQKNYEFYAQNLNDKNSTNSTHGKRRQKNL